ncbi:hypothetical protein [Herpetosiphon gulosus]|uniref:Uncharacterized protein n=1 Tax=Herpetosiphon gulosus TaxID=1973496 RepID=A0ABP9WXX3_9CHLR
MSDFLDYVSLIKRLEIIKNNLRIIKIQESNYGIGVPLHMENEIRILLNKLKVIKDEILYIENNVMDIINKYINDMVEQRSNYRYIFNSNGREMEMDLLFLEIIRNKNDFIYINNDGFDMYFDDLLNYISNTIIHIKMLPVYINFSNKRIKDINKFIKENVHNLLGIKRKDVFYILKRSCDGYDIDFIPKVYFIFCNIDEIQKIKKDDSINKIKKLLSILYRPCIFIYKDKIEYKSIFRFKKIYNIANVIDEFIEREESIIIEQDDNF